MYIDLYIAARGFIRLIEQQIPRCFLQNVVQGRLLISYEDY